MISAFCGEKRQARPGLHAAKRFRLMAEGVPARARVTSISAEDRTTVQIVHSRESSRSWIWGYDVFYVVKHRALISASVRYL